MSDRTTISWLVASVTIALMSGILGGFVNHTLSENGARALEYKDFISIMLTGLGVMIAVLAVMLAAMAVIGWRSLEDKLEESASKYFDRKYESGIKLKELVRQALVDLKYEGMSPVTTDEPYVDDDTPTGGKGK